MFRECTAEYITVVAIYPKMYVNNIDVYIHMFSGKKYSNGKSNLLQTAAETAGCGK